MPACSSRDKSRRQSPAPYRLRATLGAPPRPAHRCRGATGLPSQDPSNRPYCTSAVSGKFGWEPAGADPHPRTSGLSHYQNEFIDRPFPFHNKIATKPKISAVFFLPSASEQVPFASFSNLPRINNTPPVTSLINSSNSGLPASLVQVSVVARPPTRHVTAHPGSLPATVPSSLPKCFPSGPSMIVCFQGRLTASTFVITPASVFSQGPDNCAQFLPGSLIFAALITAVLPGSINPVPEPPAKHVINTFSLLIDSLSRKTSVKATILIVSEVKRPNDCHFPPPSALVHWLLEYFVRPDPSKHTNHNNPAAEAVPASATLITSIDAKASAAMVKRRIV